jgi:hypothetical protein
VVILHVLQLDLVDKGRNRQTLWSVYSR